MKPHGRRRWRKREARSRQRYRRTAKRDGYKLHPDELKTHKGVHLKERKVCGILPPLPSREFSQRSLVGMSQRRRKVLAWLLWSTEPGSYEFAKSGYRLGERLRPCPGCADCSADLLGWMSICDGSGVLPAKRHRRCGWWLNTRTAKNATQRCGMPLTSGGWLDCQHCGGSGWLMGRGE